MDVRCYVDLHWAVTRCLPSTSNAAAQLLGSTTHHGPSPSSHSRVELIEIDGNISLTACSFKVEDKGLVKSPLLAWACIRLDRLGQGYRFVDLLNPKGDPIKGGKLLVKIDKTMC